MSCYLFDYLLWTYATQAPSNVVLARDRKKLKRKAGQDGADAESSTAAAKKKQAKGPRNTAIYITGLPLNATVEEVSEVFSKAGLILLDAAGQPKIKLYTDSKTGRRNGDGLIVYYKEESMTLAQSLFDEAPLRIGDHGNTMKVTKAQWDHKEANAEDDKEKDDGKPKKKGKSNAEAQKMQRRAEKLQKEAADYDPSYDERESGLAAVGATSNQQGGAKAAGGRVVVLAHVFTLEELEEDASLLLDLKEDVREECEALGTVTNVVLYDVSSDILSVSHLS